MCFKTYIPSDNHQMSHLVEQISLVVYGVKFMVLIDQSILGLIEHNIMII